MQSISDIHWQELLEESHTPSPESWSDQVFYFVMTDRFSDGKEKQFRTIDGAWSEGGTTPPYTENEYENAIANDGDAARWRARGDEFVGGTLRGLQSKLGYIQRLGVTTIWLSPVLKQPAHDRRAYHGYGTQDFLAIDPHYGTREDLKNLVIAAHTLGIYIVLDIIFNHAGYVFKYDLPGGTPLEGEPPFKYESKYPVLGYCDAEGTASIPFAPVDLQLHPHAWPDGAVWPKELQHPSNFHARGCITDWDDPENYLNGDFLYLKDFNLGKQSGESFAASEALIALIAVYKYWVAFADLDGFRIDAVKHMPVGALQLFVKEIKDFTKQLGKENFLFVGEIPGGIPNAKKVLAETGMDMALGIDDLPRELVGMVRGSVNPSQYFGFMEEHVADAGPADVHSRKLITLYDDHDQIRLGYDKARFPAGTIANKKLAQNAVFTLLTTQGVPCIYYGSEQGFDGSGRDDNYIREAMFGGDFGAFRSKGAHFFNEAHPSYTFFQQLLTFRKQHPVLIHGAQVLLQTSGDGEHFGVPAMIGGQLKGIIPWLRYANAEWLLCAINTDAAQASSAWVNLGESVKETDVKLDAITPRYLFASTTALLDQQIAISQVGMSQAVQLMLPPAGCAVVGLA